MRFHNAYVRGTLAGPVPEDQIHALARILAERPEELVLTAHGIRRRGERLSEGELAARALARRNIRSLIVRSAEPQNLVPALKAAIERPPRPAEDALEDAGLVFNLRHSIFATRDAWIRFDGDDLVVEDDRPPSVTIARKTLREEGLAYFGASARARLVSLAVERVRIAPSAIMPTALQIEPGGLMDPDTAQLARHKGDWRSVRQAVFAKDHCITCGRCFIHCPEDAIIHAMHDPQAVASTGILGVDLERCTGCGMCAAVCPVNENGYKAIVMVDAGAEHRPEDHHVG